MGGRDFIYMMNYAIREIVNYDYLRFAFPKQSQFEKRIKNGVSLYVKPKKNNNNFQYKKTNFNRRITSKRVFTHTKK